MISDILAEAIYNQAIEEVNKIIEEIKKFEPGPKDVLLGLKTKNAISYTISGAHQRMKFYNAVGKISDEEFKEYREKLLNYRC